MRRAPRVEFLEPRRLLAAAIPSFTYNVIEPTTSANGHKPKAIADFTGDGHNDVMAYWLGHGLQLYTWPNWTRVQITSTDLGNGEQAQVADVDNDGDMDLLVGGDFVTTRWYENPLAQGGDPTVVKWPERTIGNGPGHDLEISDLNHDGRVDVFIQTVAYLNNGNNSWTTIASSRFATRNGQGTALGDLDGDGYDDLVDAVDGGHIAWWRNPGAAGGQATTNWTKTDIGATGYSGDELSLRVTDVDLDGRNDVLMANEYGSGGLWWWKNPGPGGTWTRTLIDSSIAYVHQSALLVGDINLDGRQDIFVSEQEQSLPAYNAQTTDTLGGEVVVYYREANATPTWTKQTLALTGGHNSKLGDIDDDGDLDLLVANHGFYGAPNPVHVWRNNWITTVNGTPNADSFAVGTSGSNLSITVNGTTTTYPQSGVGSVVFSGASGADTLDYNATVQPVVLFRGGGGGTDQLRVNAGTMNVVEDLGAGGATVAVTVAAGAVANFQATQHLAALNVAGSARMAAGGGNRVLVAKSLGLSGAGELDLADHDMIVDYDTTSPLNDIAARIAQSRANGWLGPGIFSSVARVAPNGNTTLGTIERADYFGTTFDNEPLDATAVLVKYTYYGDANFDGRVTFDDYARIDTGFNAHRTGWANGDFNLDGAVNFDDYVLIDTAFNTQSSALKRVPAGSGHRAASSSR